MSSNLADFNVIIIGQGLAGTALAWSLHWLGIQVQILDRESETSSSKIAAGLITPVTGQKLVPSWRLSELWPSAVEFYRHVERVTGTQFLQLPNMVRLFTDETEAALFQRRNSNREYGELVRSIEVSFAPDSIVGPHGGFEMGPGGQLDVGRYLSASREYFRQIGGYRNCDVDLMCDLEISSDEILFRPAQVRSHRVIFCQGFETTSNTWFDDVRFKPAKGEILTVRVPGLREGRVIHRGVWLAPLGDELFKVGSTYDWAQLDSEPTNSGLIEITSRLKQFLLRPFEVVGHDAAIRPIHQNQYPIMGWHPVLSRLGLFNGLGSKGVLHAPYFAKQFASHLVHGTPIDRSVDLNQKTDWRDPKRHAVPGSAPISANSPAARRSIPLTERAQAAVRAVIGLGDAVIDATVGNGYDTQFLAEQVGPSGVVHGFDIQSSALAATATRLLAAGLNNVQLWNRDHADMLSVVPAELYGGVAAVMFNLGYLPGGDKKITTRETSTRAAIDQAAVLLRPGGVISILVYTGHDQGAAEAQAVASLVDQLLTSEYQTEIVESAPGRHSGPRLFVVRKSSLSGDTANSCGGSTGTF